MARNGMRNASVGRSVGMSGDPIIGVIAALRVQHQALLDQVAKLERALEALGGLVSEDPASATGKPPARVKASKQTRQFTPRAVHTAATDEAGALKA